MSSVSNRHSAFLFNVTQTLRVKWWHTLRRRCSSLSQQHMAEKFAKVCSYCSWLEYFIFLLLWVCMWAWNSCDETSSGPKWQSLQNVCTVFTHAPSRPSFPAQTGEGKKCPSENKSLSLNLNLFFSYTRDLSKVFIQQCAKPFCEPLPSISGMIFLMCPNQILVLDMDKGRKS